VFLQDAKRLRDHATQLAMGEESELRVVIGDLGPLRETLDCCAVFSMTVPAPGCTFISKPFRDRGSACSKTRRT
jgi:hypothetical protein